MVAGSQQALEISARVLLGNGSPVWIEEPGYRLARSVFQGAGCRLVPVPVDEDGMNVSAGIKQCAKARAAVCYAFPSISSWIDDERVAPHAVTELGTEFGIVDHRGRL